MAVAAALAGCREHAEPRDLHVATPELAAPTAAPHLYAAAPGSFVDVVAGARHGVVAIHAAQPVKSGPAAMFPGSPESVADVALGTGFLIEAKGVYVVTNDHIAAASNELRVVLPDRTVVPAKLVGRDVALDVALLSIEAPRLQALPLGDSDDLAVGEWIVALGDPFGDEVSASAGIVSSTGREAAGSLEPVRALGFRTYIQTDARIHRGNSGGPVLNTAGQVIGVAVATGDRPGELSFVLPIDRVREVLDALRDVGQVSRSWLGVLVKPVTPELASSLALPRPTGALVTELEPGSPAARAGLRAGDIILKWGEHDVDHRSLPWLVSAAPAGKPVTVEVWRDRTDVPIAVVPERMPQ
ncbi:MAG TPA: trypsin-like peptidase domain-containing protein [Kofleriaceae bacterium]|nr:trypsin-like peptidase domain-containing protein [Kofleriaceae bacterium]